MLMKWNLGKPNAYKTEFQFKQNDFESPTQYPYQLMLIQHEQTEPCPNRIFNAFWRLVNETDFKNYLSKSIDNTRNKDCFCIIFWVLTQIQNDRLSPRLFLIWICTCTTGTMLRRLAVKMSGKMLVIFSVCHG